jgi:energy-coupling factor transport system permease protein
MLNDMTMGRYFPGRSLLHRSDPRTKIVLTLLFIGITFALKSYPALLLLLIMISGIAFRTGTPLQQSLRSLRLVLYLAVVAVVANLLFIKGEPLIDYGLLRHISREAVDISVKMVLRLVLLAGAASLLTFTTTPFALTDGLEKLLAPLNRIGLPVSEIALMMLIALRFMPVIVDEAEKLIKIQSARSADFNRGNLLRRTGSYLPLFIPLFAGIARRGDAMATAMEARCYRGGRGRTKMRPLEFSGADIAVVAGMLLMLSLLFGVEYMA